VCSCCNQALDLSQFPKRAVENPGACKHCRLKQARRNYNAKNKGRWVETKRAASATWKANNPDKVSGYRKASYAKNPSSWLQAARNREFDQLNRTAEWDSELTKLAFAEAVDLRQRRASVTGFAWEIDHVVPLRGKLVSGLHVWNNLRVIPQTINRRKYNAYDIL